MKRVVAAGGIVINQHNELLMICRRLKWDLPKGHLEKKETLEQCAVREVKEETGLKTLQVRGLTGITEHVYYDNKFNEEVIKEIHWFEMKGDKNEKIVEMEVEGIEWAQWIPKGQIQRYLRNSFKNIEEIIKKSSLYQ